MWGLFKVGNQFVTKRIEGLTDETGILWKIWRGKGKPSGTRKNLESPLWDNVKTSDTAKMFRNKLLGKGDLSKLPKIEQANIKAAENELTRFIRTGAAQRINFVRKSPQYKTGPLPIARNNLGERITPASEGLRLPAKIGGKEVPQVIRDDLRDILSSNRQQGLSNLTAWGAKQSEQTRRLLVPWITIGKMLLAARTLPSTRPPAIEFAEPPYDIGGARLEEEGLFKDETIIGTESGPFDSPLRVLPKQPTEDVVPPFTKGPTIDPSIYTKIAEDKFGQKVFGLRRSKPELNRDIGYTTLREEEELGIDPDLRTKFKVGDRVYTDSDVFLEAWNQRHSDLRERALSRRFPEPFERGARNLTAATMDRPREMGSSTLKDDIIDFFLSQSDDRAEDFVAHDEGSGQRMKSGGKVSKKKKVSRSYKPKSTKKQYAKNGSVRKPKRI